MKKLKVKEIESLENTSVASILGGFTDGGENTTANCTNTCCCGLCTAVCLGEITIYEIRAY